MAGEKILVVDDEQDIRDIVRLHLERAGFEVLDAENGEEAINILKQGDNLATVGLIFSDIRMPKLNGVDLIDQLKLFAPKIPIVVITGYPDAELAVTLLKKGIKDYLVKPVERKKLLEMAETMVRGQG